MGSPSLGGAFGDYDARRRLQPACTDLVPSLLARFNTGMKSLAVRVLGDFGVDGVEPQALGSRKARLALHLLALADGQAVAADVLIDALWGSELPARPEDQLAVLMSRLRSVLGRHRIEHRDQGYLLHRDWLDAAELAVLIREMETRREAGHLMGAVAAARVALSLIRGGGPQPLPGEWAQLRQAELERLTGRARLVAATVLLGAGDWMAACDAAAAAIERDPYDEASLRVLLRGYVAGGRVAAALAAYASARTRMADELGTDPSPETAALYTAILRGEAARPGRSRPGRPGRRAGLPRGGRDPGPRWSGRGGRGRRRGRHREDDAAAGLGRPARGGRGHGADGGVRAARPVAAARRAADRDRGPAA
jgi:DNA-binding SARP family transcriptional activator